MQNIFIIAGSSVSGLTILYWGLVICVIGMMFGVLQYKQTKNLPAHKSMLDVSATIWETCKTYLTQQGKFLAYLWALIAICIIYYFAGLQNAPVQNVLLPFKDTSSVSLNPVIKFTTLFGLLAVEITYTYHIFKPTRFWQFLGEIS